MQFSFLDFKTNDTCEGMNVTHLTELMLLHYLVKVKTPKMHVGPFGGGVSWVPT